MADTKLEKRLCEVCANKEMAHSAQVNEARELIKSGADVNYKLHVSDRIDTPLSKALTTENIELVKLLVDNGAHKLGIVDEDLSKDYPHTARMCLGDFFEPMFDKADRIDKADRSWDRRVKLCEEFDYIWVKVQRNRHADRAEAVAETPVADMIAGGISAEAALVETVEADPSPMPATS